MSSMPSLSPSNISTLSLVFDQAYAKESGLEHDVLAGVPELS